MTPTQAQYRALVSQLAAQRDEFTHPQQLGALTNEQKALVLAANADIAADLEFDTETLAEVYRGNLDPGLYLASLVEPLIRRELFWAVQEESERERERLEAQRFDADEYNSAELRPSGEFR